LKELVRTRQVRAQRQPGGQGGEQASPPPIGAATGRLDPVMSAADTEPHHPARPRPPRSRLNVAATLRLMTLHGRDYEVGVRELHDRLSEHLDHVQQGADLVVTRRGTPIARLSAITGDDPLQELSRRGLITPPRNPRQARTARVKPRGPVSELVADQRR
jgi:prevent-host-death family protein